MLVGPNMMRSHGLEPLLNSSSVLGTKASSGMTSTSSLMPSLSLKSFSPRDSGYFTYSALTTARMVVPSYGLAPCAGACTGITPAATIAISTSRTARNPSCLMREFSFEGLKRQRQGIGPSAFRTAEGQALDQIALEHERDGEGGEDAEHHRGRGFTVEHVGAAAGVGGDQHHHGLGLDPGQHDREEELVQIGR